jgi:hypothetical protein
MPDSSPATLALLEEDLLRAHQKIKKLEAQLAERARLVYEAPYYWLIQDGAKEGPFCQRCKDVDDKLVRLQSCPNPGAWFAKSATTQCMTVTIVHRVQ